LRAIRHVALDLDGTIYCDGEAFSWTLDALAELHALGIGYTFLTNNCSRSPAEYLDHLSGIGIEAKVDEIRTPAGATVEYLSRERPDARTAYILGTPSLRAEFAQAGIRHVGDEDAASSAEPDVVVVGFDTALRYEELCRAAWWIRQSKPFIATNPDRVCPTNRPTVLIDCGSVCAALEAATGRAPDVVLGKPDPRMLEGLLAKHGIDARNLAMVGDRIYTDIAMARAANAFAVLVLSGEASADDARTIEPHADLVVDHLGEFCRALREACGSSKPSEG
jgi:HAD superfamily hydrolase (TIGR01450 family)